MIDHTQLYARYRKLFRAYCERCPESRDDPRGLLQALDAAECALLDHPPPGKRKGLLLPSEMVGKPRVMVPRLKSLTIEEAEIIVLSEEELRVQIDNLNRTPPQESVTDILDQDGAGSCAAEACDQATMTRRNQDGQKRVKLNPWFAYRVTSGGVDRGSSIRDGLAFMQEFGLPSMEVWPRSKGLWTKPPPEVYEDAAKYRIAADGVIQIRNWPELATMVIKGYAVVFGYTGHAILAVNCADPWRVIYANSWGSDWNGNGFGTLHRDRIYWGYESFAVVAVMNPYGQRISLGA